MKLSDKETKHFVWLWNEATFDLQEVSVVPGMRYVEADMVTWNEYDAPTVSVSQIAELAKRVKKEKPTFQQIATKVTVYGEDL